MNTIWIFLLFSWLIRSAIGRLVLLGLVLWYLDDRYVGLVAQLWAPVRRARNVSGLRHAVQVNPSDVRAMVELGEHYLQSGNPGTAAEYLQRAIDRGEDSARALYLLGGAQVKLGRHAEGRANLEAAVAKTATVGYGEPYLFLLEAVLATEGAQSAPVEELVDRLDDFDSVETLTRAGRLCAGAGRTDLARPLFERAIHNYGYTPKAMRRRERRWLIRAQWGKFQLR